MSDGLWSFYVLFTQGHAKVISGGVGGVRGVNFLLRTVSVPSTGLDDVLVYSAWFGMEVDTGRISVMSFLGMLPRQVKSLGEVYESTCSGRFPVKATIASKVFLDDPGSLTVNKDYYVRQCGDNRFRFLKSSQEEAGDVLSSLSKK